jgi:hypothetical protein
MKKIFMALSLWVMFFFPSLAKGKQLTLVEMETYFKKNQLSKIEREELKKSVLKVGPPAMTLLTKVLRENSYPDHSRWSACFFVGQLMGKKAQNYLVKFTEHPLWLLRVAALKTLLHIKADNVGPIYAKKLKDESYLVRVQALESIAYLKLDDHAKDIYQMLFDKKNYTLEKGKYKRSEIIKQALKTLGDFKYQPMAKGLVKMMKKESYKDLHSDIDSALTKITGLKSSGTNLEERKNFWSNQKL